MKIKNKVSLVRLLNLVLGFIFMLFEINFIFILIEPNFVLFVLILFDT